MENILDKLDNINQTFILLDDNDKEKFNEIAINHLNQLNNIILSLENLLKQFNISEENIKNFDSENKRNSILMKNLFIPYFLMSQQLSNSSNEDINKLENEP